MDIIQLKAKAIVVPNNGVVLQFDSQCVFIDATGKYIKPDRNYSITISLEESREGKEVVEVSDEKEII